MTTTAAYYPSLTGAVAREHVNDLLREATAPGRRRAAPP